MTRESMFTHVSMILRAKSVEHGIGGTSHGGSTRHLERMRVVRVRGDVVDDVVVRATDLDDEDFDAIVA